VDVGFGSVQDMEDGLDLLDVGVSWCFIHHRSDSPPPPHFSGRREDGWMNARGI